MWNLIKYFKSYSFRRQFRRQFSTVFHVILQAPSNGIMATALKISVKFERVTSKCYLMRLMWNLLEYFNIYIHLDVNSDVNSQTVFHVILQAPSAGTTATAQ